MPLRQIDNKHGDNMRDQQDIQEYEQPANTRMHRPDPRQGRKHVLRVQRRSPGIGRLVIVNVGIEDRRSDPVRGSPGAQCYERFPSKHASHIEHYITGNRQLREFSQVCGTGFMR